MTTDEAKQEIQRKIAKYQSLSKSERKGYNEANTVNSFVRPLFEALGWEFSDINQVEAEKTIVKGRVDFLFKIDRVSCFCLEVKSLRDDLTDEYREQAVSYAYNKGVTWAVLTNFDRLQVLNAERQATDVNDLISLNISYEEYLSEFDDLNLLSREWFPSGTLERKAVKTGKLARRIPVEKRLYQHLKESREKLFNEVYRMHRDQGITLEDTDRLIQKLFDRLIFIRTAEDRGLASNHPLEAALHQWQQDKGIELIETLRGVFRDFTDTYDSDLFPITDPWGNVWVSSNRLAAAIEGLYNVHGDFARYDFYAIDADVLGQVYEQYLGYIAQVAKEEVSKQQLRLIPPEEKYEITAKKEKRKGAGIYYTPKWVTDYIVRQTVGRFIEEHTHDEILNMKILDPACGSGSFLIRAYDELLNYHARVRGKNVADLHWTERIAILTRNIFGVDLDPQAVEIAKLNLLLRALAEREALPPLANNIQCGDSLISGTDEDLYAFFGEGWQDKKPFNWEERFNDIMQNGGFDVVIGNPPYVMELREHKGLFRSLRATQFGQTYYEPKMDIFYFFIERGIDLMKPNGYLGFIILEYWTSRAHASKLQNKIFTDAPPIILVDFGEYKVFRDAPGQHNMVIVLKKTRKKEFKTQILSLKKSEPSEQEIIMALGVSIKEQDVFETKIVPVKRLYNPNTGKVYLDGVEVSDIRTKLEQDSVNFDNKEIQQGVVTPQHSLTSVALAKLDNSRGCKVGDGIFILSKIEVENLKLNKDEQNLLRPFHYADDIDSFFYKTAIEYYLIYTTREMVEDIESNPEKYPAIKSHLDRYAPIVTSDNKPYGIHRARQPYWFEDIKKIVGVRKTRYPKFVIVPEPYYADQAVIIIRLAKHRQFSAHFITAILNSHVAHFWFFRQKRHGQQLQIDKEVLLHFPIPNIDLNCAEDKQVHDDLVNFTSKIIRLTKKLAECKAQGKDIFGEERRELKDGINKTNETINELVYQLYGLTEEEREIVGKGGT